MKLKLIISLVIFLISQASTYACPVASPPAQQQSTGSKITNSQWLDLGEVTMFYTVGRYEKRRIATLFACSLGERMLYKVNFNEKKYSVTPNDRYGKNEVWYYYPHENAKVTIDGVTYYLSVPTW